MNKEQKIKIRRRMQVALALLAVFPLVSGVLGLAGASNPIFEIRYSSDMVLDSNLRFLNGMSVAIAVSVYLILPLISKETFAFRILMAAFICGAAGRSLSIFAYSYFSLPLVTLALVELLSPALLIYYQNKIKD
ncbi:MAG TPA: DUF4345 domain-containing protein [Dyadobacter sp.]|nr:DUF4345 domain-containing protein [Dyadobacter sp.]